MSFENHIAKERVFEQVSGMVLKLVNKNHIRLLTCNDLFITYYMLNKQSSHQVEVQESVYKTAKHAKFDARRQLKYNVRDWSNQIITIYLIGQFKPVKWYDIISLSEMISYHITGIIFIHRGYMPARGYEF